MIWTCKRAHVRRDHQVSLLAACHPGQRILARERQDPLANISKLPEEAIEALHAAIKGSNITARVLKENFEIVCSLPRGHVVAVPESLKMCRLHTLVDPRPSTNRSLVMAMVAVRVPTINSNTPWPRLSITAVSASAMPWTGCSWADRTLAWRHFTGVLLSHQRLDGRYETAPVPRR